MRLLLLTFTLLLAGCTYNPSPSLAFPAPKHEVDEAWARMRDEPVELQRPLIIIDGWLPMGSESLERELTAATGAGDEEVLRHWYIPVVTTMEGNARHVVEEIEQRWPSCDEQWTTEVDVVGYSMGGIIARHAERPAPDDPAARKRLRIRNLYTIATPHAGTRGFITAVSLDDMSIKTKRGSSYLAELNSALTDTDYELVCYAVLGDLVVGAQYSAPPGHHPIWVNGSLVFNHSFPCSNRRILVDIAARLRGEPSLAGEPSEPPHQ